MIRFLLTCFLASISFSTTLSAKTDMEIVKQRVLDGILAPPVDEAVVTELIQSVREDGSWPGIDYEDLSRTAFEHRIHLVNLEILSLAYNKESSSYYESHEVRDLILRSLEFWCDHNYISGNWYHKQVSTPTNLVNVLLLMDHLIEPDLKTAALEIIGRAHLNAPGARPGGDRIKFGGIAAKKGLVVGDEAAFGEIMKEINAEIKFNTGGRGMQVDYSFHHRYDRVNTTCSYGTSYADVFAEWAAYVSGTGYAFTADKIAQLIDYYLDGICKRPAYFTSVRMFSVRNQNMEYPHNSEGILNHHRGDGTNHLSKKGDEYLNIWPVYDWQKIPGTTILQKEKLPPPEEVLINGVTSFVGAVTDGAYGAVAFDFISPHDFTRARKGWFFFDDEYVCLGAGIESPSRELPVVTTMNQELLEGEVLVSDGRDVEVLAPGEHEREGTQWVFHNGTGYFFPDSTTVHITNQAKSGSWTKINKQSLAPRELVTRDVFSLWIDHGVRPQGNIGLTDYASTIPEDVKYQNMVVPVIGVEQMKEDRGIKILVNNRRQQAVEDLESGLVQAIFYHAGVIMRVAV